MIFILSKKGFDSSNGGIPSPVFVPDETGCYKYISLPIPSDDYPCKKYEKITKDIIVPPGHKSVRLCSLIDSLLENDGKKFIMNNGKQQSSQCDDKWCHYDPMLESFGNAREIIPETFEAGFGQSDGFVTTIEKARQSNPSNDDVVFLFWGRFHEAECKDGKVFRFKNTEDGQRHEDFYAIWGYMKISSVIRKGSDFSGHDYLFKYHSHSTKMANASDKGKGQEAIYVSSPGDRWKNGMKYPTYDVFTYMGRNDSLVLSKIDDLSGFSYAPRRWRLPKELFDGHLTYQQKKGIDPNDHSFWITSMGQECVWKATNGEDSETNNRNKEACNGYLEDLFLNRLKLEKTVVQ